MNWWLIVAIVVFALIIFKFKEVKHKFGLMAIIIIILFIVASFGQLYTKNNLNLSNFDGIVDAGKVYFSWLGQAAHNIGKVSTYAVKQEWDTPVNSTTLTRK